MDKILFYISSLNRGGAERVLVAVMNYCKEGQVPFRTPIPKVGLLLRRCSGTGLHLAMTGNDVVFLEV